MADGPYVTPEEATAAEAVAAIGDELAIIREFSGEEWFRHIMDQMRKLPLFPEAWQDAAHSVPGCQAKVWMEAEVREGRIFFAGSSNSVLVSGLIALLLRVYSGRTPDEILTIDPNFATELGLVGTLTTNRGNGVAAMVRAIRERAAAARALT
jgi:cysteine desulfuration protein SufE